MKPVWRIALSLLLTAGAGCDKTDMSPEEDYRPAAYLSKDALPERLDTAFSVTSENPQEEVRPHSVSSHCGCLPVISITHQDGVAMITFPSPSEYKHSNIVLSYSVNGTSGSVGQIDPTTIHRRFAIPTSLGNQPYELTVTLTCNEKDATECNRGGGRCTSVTTFSYSGSGGGAISSPGNCGRNYSNASVHVSANGQAFVFVEEDTDTGSTRMVPDQYEIFSQTSNGNPVSCQTGPLVVGQNEILYSHSTSFFYSYFIRLYSSACGDHENHFLQAPLTISPDPRQATETNEH